MVFKLRFTVHVVCGLEKENLKDIGKRGEYSSSQSQGLLHFVVTT